MATGFGVQSFIATAIYPKVGKPWSFGLHQCSHPREWKKAGGVLKKGFIESLDDLCTKSGEIKSNNRADANTANDGGLDIFGWCKFPDNLVGSIVFAGACGIGANWDTKLHEVDDFFQWFVNSCVKNQIYGFFIPHCPEIDLVKWERLSTTNKIIIISRCRLAYLADDWRHDMAARLCKMAIRNIRRTA